MASNSFFNNLLNSKPAEVVRYTHIEHKYGVEIGDDWLAKAVTATFQVGQVFTFVQAGSKNNGKQGRVVDMRVNVRGDWEFATLIDNDTFPRWTAPKWMCAQSDDLPAEAPEVEYIGTGDTVTAHGKNGVDYVGRVLATNPEAGEALVKVWDREVGTHYTAWWNVEWLELKAATAAVVTAEVAA